MRSEYFMLLVVSFSSVFFVEAEPRTGRRLNGGLPLEGHVPENVYPPVDGDTIQERIRKNGYPVETHEVFTDDGYFLTLHRIPHGKGNMSKPAQRRDVFFVQHGLTLTSDFFVLDDCLVFLLADAGYDVWMGNTRGNIYSMKHAFYKVESREFWDFSFDEMAKYDVPAMVDYVLKTTDQVQLHYVGHSQGSMIALAAASENEDFRRKVKSMFLMGPVAKLENIFRPFRVVTRIFYGLEYFIDKTNIYHIPVPYPAVKRFIKWGCKVSEELNEDLCHILRAITYSGDEGNDEPNTIISQIAEWLVNLLRGSATICIKNMYHYCQLVESSRFQKYDYGWWGNLVWYWSFKPPIYDVGNIDTPITLISGSRDLLSRQHEIHWLAKHLPNVRHNILARGFYHNDLVIGKTAKTEISDKILKIAKEDKF